VRGTCRVEGGTLRDDAAAEAIGLGYVNVYLMPDGIVGWLRAKKPVEAE
jgi:rhodanese-related sulfurtransferase